MGNKLLVARKAVKRTLLRLLTFGAVQSTVFTDASEFQGSPYSNAYLGKFADFRSNDGTYADRLSQANLAWCKAAATSGRIAGFLVYMVYRPNWQATLATFQANIGSPHPKMAVEIDMESWGGQIQGDHSASANAMREQLIHWLGGNRRRVIRYGNRYDLAALWPDFGDCNSRIADYSSNAPFPGKIIHQYSQTGTMAPFGYPVDLNSADGLSPPQLAAILGLVSPPPVPKPPVPKPVPTRKATKMVLVQDKGSADGAVYLQGDDRSVQWIPDTPTVASYQQLGVPGPKLVSRAFLSGCPGFVAH